MGEEMKEGRPAMTRKRNRPVGCSGGEPMEPGVIDKNHGI